jgi:hypothetical protein
MGAETVFRLPDDIRKTLLRDAGHAPEDWHPDAHFKRETPPLSSFSQPQERTNARSKPGR